MIEQAVLRLPLAADLARLIAGDGRLSADRVHPRRGATAFGSDGRVFVRDRLFTVTANVLFSTSLRRFALSMFIFNPLCDVGCRETFLRRRTVI